MNSKSDYSVAIGKYKHYIVIQFINYDRLDLYNCRDLESAIKEQNDQGVEDLIIDMSPITFIDSSGLGLLARQGSYLSKKNKKLNLVSVSPSVTHLFGAVGFNKLFQIWENINLL